MNGEREWATDGRKAERKTAFKMEAERERERDERNGNWRMGKGLAEEPAGRRGTEVTLNRMH